MAIINDEDFHEVRRTLEDYYKGKVESVDLISKVTDLLFPNQNFALTVKSDTIKSRLRRFLDEINATSVDITNWELYHTGQPSEQLVVDVQYDSMEQFDTFRYALEGEVKQLSKEFKMWIYLDHHISHSIDERSEAS